MPKVSPIQTNFNGGEFSEEVHGRVDSDRYKTGLAVCKNYVPILQGPVIRRSGTAFVAESPSGIITTRLIPFEFSTTQAYIIEMGSGYFRFYKDHALILNAATSISNILVSGGSVTVTSTAHGLSDGDRVVITGVLGMTQVNNTEFIVHNSASNEFVLKNTNGDLVTGTGFDTYTSGGSAAEPYYVAHTYTVNEIFAVKFTQSADVLYLCHPAHHPAKLTRSGHTSWTLTDIAFVDGPYISPPTPQGSTTTLTPSAETGTGVTLTASSTSGINNDTGFQSTDVGRLIRIRESNVWGYVRITGWTSTTVVTVSVLNTLTNTSSKTMWRLGAWSATTGYPAAVVFFEDRLFFAGPTNYPNRLDGSNSGDYENFASSDVSGTVVASNALAFTLNSNKMNAIRWLTSDEKGLLIGTQGGEWVLKPASTSEGLSSTNVSAKEATTYGSANIQPVQCGKSTIFVQRTGRKLRDMSYFYDVDGFRASDVTVLNPQVTRNGVVQLAFQNQPQTIVWAVRSDGALLSMVYERDIDSFKVGWSRHFLGGPGDSQGQGATVESVAVIPSPDGLRDEVWLVVKRYINGRTVHYIEYITKFFESTDLVHDAFFGDCGVTYNASQLGYLGEDPVGTMKVTLNSHGYSTGDRVYIHTVTSERYEALELRTYVITVLTSNSFTLDGFDADEFPEPTGGYGALTHTAYFAKYVSTISGLNHLEGATLQVLGNGAEQPDVLVTNGKVTLGSAAAIVQMGYGFESDGQMLRLDAGAADGTAIGKTRRTHTVGFLLTRTLGFKFGTNFDELDEVTFRRSSDDTGFPVPLFTGIVSEDLPADYDYENQICWRQDGMLPGMVNAVFPQMVTQDRG